MCGIFSSNGRNNHCLGVSFAPGSILSALSALARPSQQPWERHSRVTPLLRSRTSNGEGTSQELGSGILAPAAMSLTPSLHWCSSDTQLADLSCHLNCIPTFLELVPDVLCPLLGSVQPPALRTLVPRYSHGLALGSLVPLVTVPVRNRL